MPIKPPVPARPDRIPDYLEPLIAELVTRVIAGVTEVIVEHLPDPNAPVLLDRNGLAKALGISLTSLDRLKHEGLPTIRVLDAPRYELSAVLEWLRARSAKTEATLEPSPVVPIRGKR